MIQKLFKFLLITHLTTVFDAKSLKRGFFKVKGKMVYQLLKDIMVNQFYLKVFALIT